MKIKDKKKIMDLIVDKVNKSTLKELERALEYLENIQKQKKENFRICSCCKGKIDNFRKAYEVDMGKVTTVEEDDVWNAEQTVVYYLCFNCYKQIRKILKYESIS